MNVEAIEAFSALTRESSGALLIFVGQDWERGEAKDKVRELGLGTRVRFLGRQDDDAFLDLMAATDVGICLRRPPTFGETSGALLHLLRQSVPTIINDVDTFADYPDSVVRKVRWESEGLAGLVGALRELASDADGRARLGRAGFEYVERHHKWMTVARRYAEVIERCHEARRRAG
jgi:glycosyltransferase involved in cell wall biosynthesis